MKISKELRVGLVGMVFSFITLLVGFFARPVGATPNCNSGACDYYSGGSHLAGTCGLYDNNTKCGCTISGGGETQSACNAPPA